MHSYFRIDPESGFVFGRRGRPSSQRNPQGYIQVRKNNRYYGMAHRVIWEYVHGSIPDGMQINHKNGVKSDNRIQNLELVTASENMMHAYRTGLLGPHGPESTTGACGVSKFRNKFKAYGYEFGRQVHLGMFDVLDDAISARKAWDQMRSKSSRKDAK